jgi:hypothetical protein
MLIFEQKPHIRTTPDEGACGDEEAYRYLNTDIKYSYAVIRKDGRRDPYGSLFTRSVHAFHISGSISGEKST